MATEIQSPSKTPQALPPELHPNVEHLVTEDDTPVDNIFSEKQQRLLTEPLYSSPGWATETRKFIALSHVGLFYAIRQPPYVPDMLLSLDVALPANLWPKSHRSYFVWEYGKPPDVVVEVVSNDEGRERSEKLEGYSRIGVRYYVIYDPERRLTNEPLCGFQLEAMGYRPMPDPLWLPGVELGLRLWAGRYEDHENTWLRWTDAAGTPIPTGIASAPSVWPSNSGGWGYRRLSDRRYSRHGPREKSERLFPGRPEVPFCHHYSSCAVWSVAWRCRIRQRQGSGSRRSQIDAWLWPFSPHRGTRVSHTHTPDGSLALTVLEQVVKTGVCCWSYIRRTSVGTSVTFSGQCCRHQRNTCSASAKGISWW